MTAEEIKIACLAFAEGLQADAATRKAKAKARDITMSHLHEYCRGREDVARKIADFVRGLDAGDVTEPAIVDHSYGRP